MFSVSWCSLVLFVLSSLVRAPLSAQEPADTFPVEEIVVTATRLPTPRSAVPTAVTVITGDELRERGVKFLADALAVVPAATLAQTGSRGGLTSLFLRGGESDYVQVIVDGVVLNQPGGAVDLGQIATTHIDRIEIVRGPVSVLYGSDAVTGVVHIFTRSGAAETRLEVSADVGRAGRRNGDASICPDYPRSPCPEGADLGSYTTRRWEAALVGSSGPLEFSLGASRFDSDGAYAFNNEYANHTLSGRLRVARGGSEVALTSRYSDGLYHYPTDGAGRLVDANAHQSNGSLAVGLMAGHFIAPRVELRLGLSYHEGDTRTIDEPDEVGDTLGFFASRSTSVVNRSKADLHANVYLGARAIATLGIEAERQEGRSTFSSRSQFGPFESATTKDRSNRAGYAQLLATPIAPLAVTVGVRTEVNDRFGSFLSWRAGANLRFGAGIVVRASAGTAFKEPTFFENYAEGFALGNPELDPERSRSWELGSEWSEQGGRSMVGVTWFDQRFENLIQYTGHPPPGEPNYVNIGEAASKGLEIEGRIGRVRGPSLAGNWVRLETEVLEAGPGTDPLFQQGQPLVRRPRNRFNLSGVLPLVGRARGGATLNHVGARRDLDFVADPGGQHVTLPGHTVVDTFLEVRFDMGASREVAIRARVENLLNEEYWEVANFPAGGRALFVGLQAGTGF